MLNTPLSTFHSFVRLRSPAKLMSCNQLGSDAPLDASASTAPTSVQAAIVQVMLSASLMGGITMVTCILLFITSRWFKRYTLSRDNMRRFQKNVIWGTDVVDGQFSGFIYGKYFVGWIVAPERGPSKATVWSMISTHDAICKSRVEIVKKNESPKKFSMYSRDGSYDNLYYQPSSVDIVTGGERPFQTTVIDSILSIFDEKKHAVVLLSGPPGCGKSAVYKQLIRRLALAKKHKSSFTNEWRMCDPGDKFSSLHTRVSPEEDQPFVVLVDEVDGILKRLGGQGITPHKNYPIEVKNKNEWNSFLDGVDAGFYKNTIFLLTTNLTLAQIDELDSSYTRGGRVDARFEVDTNGNVRSEIPEPAEVLADAYTQVTDGAAADGAAVADVAADDGDE